MPKTDFQIQTVSKADAAKILLRYHYLKDISKSFKSGHNYGLFKDQQLVGVIVFTQFPVPELAVGMLGLGRDAQEGLFELSRLCLEPEIQRVEHNLASWFVSRALKLFRRSTKVRVVLSYADAAFHSGTIYAACNFDYYGLSDPKPDFMIEDQYQILDLFGSEPTPPEGNMGFRKHSRGKVKNLKGKWVPRSQKHRFVLVFDKGLKVLWEKKKWSKNPEDADDFGNLDCISYK